MATWVKNMTLLTRGFTDKKTFSSLLRARVHRDRTIRPMRPSWPNQAALFRTALKRQPAMLDGPLLDRQYLVLGLWWRVATIGRHPGPSGSKWATSWCYLIRKVLWTSSRTLITTAIVFAPPRRGIARKNIKKVSPGFFLWRASVEVDGGRFVEGVKPVEDHHVPLVLAVHTAAMKTNKAKYSRHFTI